MALQYSVSVRNARLDAIETAIGTSAKLTLFTGAVPANCAAADPAGPLITISLPADWMAAASGGSKVLAGSWTGTASASGTAASFRVYATDGTTCGLQGTVGQGSGDLSLDNAAIQSGQTVNVTTFTIASGNA